MLTDASHRARATSQAGLSLVELLVGVAIGLIIVAGAATVVATQLSDTRRLTTEVQLQQDLRATADIITRQVRRAGYWTSASSTIWVPGASVSLAASAPIELSPGVSGNPCAAGVCISNSNSTTTSFYLQSGVIMALVGGTPQALTDSNTETINAFSMQLAPITPLTLSCPALCTDGTTACWPTLLPQELIFSITGTSVSDRNNVSRTIQSTVRIRNDQICNNLNPSNPCQLPAGSALCPSLP